MSNADPTARADDVAEPNVIKQDVWIYRIVVIALSLIVLSTVLGGLYLAVIAKGDPKVTLPEGIIAIGSAAVGALAGLLAPSPVSKA